MPDDDEPHDREIQQHLFTLLRQCRREHRASNTRTRRALIWALDELAKLYPIEHIVAANGDRLVELRQIAERRARSAPTEAAGG